MVAFSVNNFLPPPPQQKKVDMDMEDTPHEARVTLETHDEKSPRVGEQTLTDNTGKGIYYRPYFMLQLV